jgi:hypothetical protein
MRVRLSLALAVLFVLALPVFAEPPKPTIVIQTQPVSRLLLEYREMIRQVGGPSEGERIVKKFQHDLEERLGEHGFDGLDINRPLAAYALVREKFDQTNFILVLPVTGEKEFLTFLGRQKIQAEAVKDKPGLYQLQIGGGKVFKTTRLQFVEGGWAYLGINGEEVADAASRVPVADLFDNADRSLFTAKLYPGRFPEKLLKSWLDEMDMTAAGLKQFMAGPDKNSAKLFQVMFEEGPKLIRRYAETGIEEAAEVRLRFEWEPMTGEGFTELTLVPRADTDLAREVRGKAASISRFAGMVPADAVSGLSIKLPLFARELREMIAALLEFGKEELKTGDLPDTFKPVVEELANGLIANVRKGIGDSVAALMGPDKTGKFTLLAAATYPDPSRLEKAIRTAAKPADLAKHFTFDVEKVDGISIHKVPFSRVLRDDKGAFDKAFGESPPSYVAFAKDAIYLTHGPNALEAIKAALAVKPGPAPVLELTGNTARFHKLVETQAGAKEAATFAKFLGTEDKAASMLRVTVEGGEKLTVKAALNLRYLPRIALLGENADATFKTVPPPR